VGPATWAARNGRLRAHDRQLACRARPPDGHNFEED